MPSRLAPESEASARHGGHVPAMQRRRLLLTLVELVGEQGLEAANVGAVCARAGVSRRTFYELFEDREACMLSALEQSVEQLAARMKHAQRGQGRWQERIRASLLALLEQLDREPDLARLCVVQTPRAGPAVMALRKRVLDSLAAAVDEGRTQARQGGGPPPLTAHGIVGGVLSVVHAQLLEEAPPPLVELANQLMAMIVHPYLGRRPPRAMRPKTRSTGCRSASRTARRGLAAISSQPAASNRVLADASGIGDEGQISRLLRRLEDAGLVENLSAGRPKGEPNAWTLTARGEAVHAALDAQAAYPAAA